MKKSFCDENLHHKETSVNLIENGCTCNQVNCYCMIFYTRNVIYLLFFCTYCKQILSTVYIFLQDINNHRPGLKYQIVQIFHFVVNTIIGATLRDILSSGFPTRPNTNQAVQPQNVARTLKFWIFEEEGFYCLKQNEL